MVTLSIDMEADKRKKNRTDGRSSLLSSAIGGVDGVATIIFNLTEKKTPLLPHKSQRCHNKMVMD